MKQLFSIFVAVAAGVSAGSVAQQESRLTHRDGYWIKTLQGAIPRASIHALKVQTVGNVVLRGDAGPSLVYTLTVRVKAEDQKVAERLLGDYSVESQIDGDEASLTIHAGHRESERPELALGVPRGLRQVWIGTRAGNVQATDLDGELVVRSGGGDMEVVGVRGAAELRTGGGNIRVSKAGGALRCFSGAGAVQVDGVGGESTLETAGGDIIVRQAGAAVHAMAAGGNIRIDRVSGPVFASTGGGLIQVERAQGAVTAENSGGAIEVNGANGVQCDSAGGAIRLRGISGRVHASTNMGSILAELAERPPVRDSMLSTRAGDITVLIPSNIAMTVRAANSSGAGAGRILSDFPEVRVRAGGQGGVPITAAGAVNGGGPLLRIDGSGGTIYLRRK